MKEEICLLFFFSRSFLLRIKLVLMSLYHFRWIFSFGFFLLLLLLLLYSGLLSHVIGIFKSFSFIVFLFFSPLVPFDIANSTQLLQYSYGYNEKKKKNTKKLVGWNKPRKKKDNVNMISLLTIPVGNKLYNIVFFVWTN